MASKVPNAPLPPVSVSRAHGSLTGSLTWMHHSFQELVSVERLLLLEEENVRGQRKTSSGLAVRWIWPRNTLSVGKVWSVVFSHAALHDTTTTVSVVTFKSNSFESYLILAATVAGPSLAP